MPVAINYTVHGVSRSTVQRTVNYGGEDVEATVPALVVELVADGMGHSYTFIGADAAAAESLFEQDGSIVATFSKGK